MEIYKLQKPIHFNGEEITELKLDLDSLSTKDLENAEKAAKKLLPKKEQMMVPETNKKYLACVAATAAGVSKGLIFSLGAKDYTKLAFLVSDFLLDEEFDLDVKLKEMEETQTQDSNTRNLV